MGSENTSGESTHSRYIDSIISSHCIPPGQPADIEVPTEAEYLSLEGGGGMRIVTFYRSRSRPDLVNVPESWKGEKEDLPCSAAKTLKTGRRIEGYASREKREAGFSGY